MSAAQIIERLNAEGVFLNIDVDGNLKVEGDRQTVEAAIPTLKKHKLELVAALKRGGEQVSACPSPCQGCAALEVTAIAGAAAAGCVKKMTDTSPWVETWRRIPADLPHCPAPNKKRMAQGYGCGKCGANRYQETPDGWKCEVCGKIYALIGGSRGPVTIH